MRLNLSLLVRIIRHYHDDLCFDKRFERRIFDYHRRVLKDKIVNTKLYQVMGYKNHGILSAGTICYMLDGEIYKNIDDRVGDHFLQFRSIRDISDYFIILKEIKK